MSLRPIDGLLKQLEAPPVDPRPQKGIKVLAVSPEGEITEIHRSLIPRAPQDSAPGRRFRR